MRILVTNDDGIDADGLHSLVGALATTGHDLLVVAPDRNFSGAGAGLGALGLDEPVSAARVVVPGAPDVEAFALDGPPALTVFAAMLGGFGEPPDLVVSGINAGANTGRAMLHSGTVGAALTGQNLGIKGLAVSADYGPTPGAGEGDASAPGSNGFRYDTAATIALDVLPHLLDAPNGTVLNLNVPALDAAEVRGVRWARLATFGAVRARMAGRHEGDGESRLDLVLEPTGLAAARDSDQGVLADGYASVTSVVGVLEAWPDLDRIDPHRIDPSTIDVHPSPGADLHRAPRLGGDVPIVYVPRSVESENGEFG